MLWVIVVVFASTALLLRFLGRWNYWKKRGVPHLKPLPFFGNMLPTIFRKKSLIDVATEVYHSDPNSSYVGYYQFSTPILMIKDPELIKQIAIKDFDVFAERNAFVPEDVDPLWANGLFATRAEKWRELRPRLSPAFTTNKMKIMFVLMEECALQFVDFFKTQTSKSIEVELKDVLTRYTNDVIATTAFGIKCDSLKDKNNEFHEMGRDLTNFRGIRSLKFVLYSISPLIMKIFNVKILPAKPASYFQSIIKRTIKEREERKIIRPDMIHLLLEARKSGLKNDDDEQSASEFGETATRKVDITDDDIASQAMIFFLAGFETVSSTMCFTLYELAVHMEIQERLLEEVDRIYEETGGKLTYEAISQLKYMEMVISESLRKWAQAVITDRKTLKPYTIQPKSSDGKPLHLEPGTVIHLPMYMVQRDEKYFPNPEKFDPERFNDENKNKIVGGTYFPFGMGPRICIGFRFAMLEMKTLMFHLLKEFKVEPCGKTPIPLVLDKSSINLQPKGGFWMQFKRRT